MEIDNKQPISHYATKISIFAILLVGHQHLKISTFFNSNKNSSKTAFAIDFVAYLNMNHNYDLPRHKTPNHIRLEYAIQLCIINIALLLMDFINESAFGQSGSVNKIHNKNLAKVILICDKLRPLNYKGINPICHLICETQVWRVLIKNHI